MKNYTYDVLPDVDFRRLVLDFLLIPSVKLLQMTCSFRAAEEFRDGVLVIDLTRFKLTYKICNTTAPLPQSLRPSGFENVFYN